MPFVVLFTLGLAYVTTEWPAPPAWLTPAGSALVAWAGATAAGAWAAWLSQRCARGLAHAPALRHVLLRRHLRWRRLHFIGLVAFFLVTLYPGGWGWTARRLVLVAGQPVPGAEILMLLPLLAALIVSLACFYDVELALERLSPAGAAVPARWCYVGLAVRQGLVPVAPALVLLLAQQSAFFVLPDLRDNVYVTSALGGGVLALVFVTYPWLLRLLLNLKPLPAGPLRERLLAAAQRLAFRCSDILVWDTQQNVATALLTGPLAALRYVVISDRLLANLTEDELESVFAHEVGHVRHRHMLFYLAFLVVSLLALAALWQFVAELVPRPLAEQVTRALTSSTGADPALLELAAAVPLLALLASYVFLIFGYLSRRCEKQADLFACRAVSFDAFVSALEKVAWLNGISRERPGWLASWRHGSIAQRVRFLESVRLTPRAERRFQQETLAMKWIFLLGMGTLVLLLGPERLLDQPAAHGGTSQVKSEGLTDGRKTTFERRPS